MSRDAMAEIPTTPPAATEMHDVEVHIPGQMVSEQGLKVYGAASDELAESIVRQPKGLYYRYGTTPRKLRVGRKQPGSAGIRSTTVHIRWIPLVITWLGPRSHSAISSPREQQCNDQKSEYLAMHGVKYAR